MSVNVATLPAQHAAECATEAAQHAAECETEAAQDGMYHRMLITALWEEVDAFRLWKISKQTLDKADEAFRLASVKCEVAFSNLIRKKPDYVKRSVLSGNTTKLEKIEETYYAACFFRMGDRDYVQLCRDNIGTVNTKYTVAKVTTDKAITCVVGGFNTYETAAIDARVAFTAACVAGEHVDEFFKEFTASVFAARSTFYVANNLANQTKAAEKFAASKAADASNAKRVKTE